MNNKEFAVSIASYYREPLIVDNRPNIRVSAIEQWSKQFNSKSLEIMLNKVIQSYIPTATSPCPLIPHIINICGIQTTEKSKLELAQAVVDRIIWAYLNIGYDKEGSRDKAYEHIGGIGKAVIEGIYGRWYNFCRIVNNTDIEYLRKSLKDSCLTYINRAERGLENQTPELEELSKKELLMLGN